MGIGESKLNDSSWDVNFVRVDGGVDLFESEVIFPLGVGLFCFGGVLVLVTFASGVRFERLLDLVIGDELDDDETGDGTTGDEVILGIDDRFTFDPSCESSSG